MRSSAHSVKLRSPGLWPAILTLAVSLGFGSGLTACIFVGDDGDHHDRRDSPREETTPPEETTRPADTPLQVAIDPDKALESPAGEGVGVFVEYTAGGHWHVWTACDTNSSNEVCAFDVFVKVTDGTKITNAQPENLESGDSVQQLDDGSLQLSAQTSTEFDGMTFDTDPGAIIELDALVDGARDPRLIDWFGGGVLHNQGAPTDPIDFKPSAP
jgi:hypothetical protein